MWTNIFDTLLKGGFGVIIFRTLVTGIRQSFLARSKEVQIIKLLRSDMQTTEERIQNFIHAINGMVTQNMSVTNGIYRCDASPLPPVDGTYKQNYADIYGIIQKYDPNVVQDLTTFFVVAHNYDVLLTSYRQVYLGTSPVTYRTDPNQRYSLLVASMGLANIMAHAGSVYRAIDKVIDGTWQWRILKRKGLYRTLAMVSAILLIFIPKREAL